MVKVEEGSTETNLGAALAREVPENTLRFWWLGQAGFALKHNTHLFLIDPYLSDSLAIKYKDKELKHRRMMPVPLPPNQIRGCDYYLCTHAHTDHMDPLTIAGVRQASAPRFIVPAAETEQALARGIPAARMVTMEAGETLALPGQVIVTAVAAAHENLEVDAAGRHRFLGYVLTMGGIKVYHSGDSVPYPGLVEQLRAQHIDIAFLPINGRDSYRLSKGIPGNFTLEEAIELCHAANISTLVGHHFDMFDFNTIARDKAAAILEEQAGDLNWILPEIGVTYEIQQQPIVRTA